MLVKIEARILIFPSTDFHFPSTSVPPGTFFKALSNHHGATSVLRSVLSRTIFAAYKAFDSFFPLKWTFW